MQLAILHMLVAEATFSPESTDKIASLSLHLLPQELASQRGAQCLDHSPAGFYLRQQNPHKWVLFLQGGGFCLTPSACKARANTSLGSSTHWSKHGSEYMVTDDSKLNPFRHYSQAYLPYCSGDTWLGTSPKHKEVLSGLQMSGHLILETLVDYLLNTTVLGRATDVVFAGVSAGGIGVFHHADWLTEKLGAAALAKNIRAPKVVAMPIAGIFFPEKFPVLFEAFKVGVTIPYKGMADDLLAMFEHAYLHPKCVANTKKHSRCWDVSKMYSYIKTPLFVVSNRFDDLQITMLGKCSWEACAATSLPESLGGRFIRFFGKTLAKTTENMIATQPSNAFFISNAYDHVRNLGLYFKNDAHRIGPFTLGKAFERWYHRNETIHLFDPTCNEDGPCNSSSAEPFYV